MSATSQPSRHGKPDHGRTHCLTEVELYWDEGHIERWLRFGRPAESRIVDDKRRVVQFAPGAIFAFVRWQANDFGTVLSRLDIVQAVSPGTSCTHIGFVRPGGEILLRQSGWPKVQQVLQRIDAIEKAGLDPCEVCPDHWQHLQNRLSAGEEPRAYTWAQHFAWRKRRKFAP